MGQYANQPDFATSAETVVVGTTNVESSALYIGTGGNIEVTAIGSFKVDESYTPIFQSLLITVYGAYFVGRTWEKNKKSSDNKNK